MVKMDKTRFRDKHLIRNHRTIDAVGKFDQAVSWMAEVSFILVC